MNTEQEKRCKIDNTPLIIKQTQKKASQLAKPYYYSAYYYCPKCQRMYFDEQFKIVNEKNDLFSHKVTFTSPSDVDIWTDGACSRNGTVNAKASWAFVAGNHEENGLVDGKQTNNRGEALAIYHALVWAVKQNYKRIRIHSDSQITLHGLMKHPSLVKENREIFQQIYDVITENNLEVDYVKVLGHSGDINNERADKLATSLVMS